MLTNQYRHRSPVRRVSIEFPAYRYVPGRNPHPIMNENGHQFGQVLLDPETQENRCQLWGYGLDLFDNHYMWEAHEVLERLWHFHRQDFDRANLIQGLILGAASCLKWDMKSTPQARKLLKRARLKVSKQKSVSAGIDFHATMDSVERYIETGQRPIIVNTLPDGWRHWP
ncbi:MAG: DUF309 domain-containing protein [Myxococcota bacterium]|nr:DUF309 domain-containing protein [Myxococcota bacterium]